MHVHRLKWSLLVTLTIVQPELTYAQSLSQIQAEQGVATFNTDFTDQQTIVRIDGSWMFAWNRLLSPKEAIDLYQSSADKTFVQLPGSAFNQTPPAKESGNRGYGSYVVKLENLPANTPLAISGMQAYTTSNLTIVSEANPHLAVLHHKIGELTTDPESIRIQLLNPRPVSFVLKDQGPHYLIIQVANFSHSWGGIWLTPSIGHQQAKAMQYESFIRSSYLVLGILLILSFYNISLYLYRKEDLASLQLGLYCLAIFLRQIAVEHFEELVSEPTAWQYLFKWKISFVSLVLPAISFMLFFQHTFPKYFGAKMVKLIVRIGMIIGAFILLTPHEIFTQFLLAYQIYCLFVAIYTISRVAVIAYHREPSSMTSLTGLLLLGVTVVNDILYNLGYQQLPSNSLPLGLAAFIFTQGQVVAKLFANAFKKVESLTLHLQEEVDRQTRDIKSIMKNIPQGIFMIGGPKATVGHDYSEFLEQLLKEKDIEGRAPVPLLFNHSNLNQEQKDITESTLLATIGEHAFNFQTNLHLLPRKTTLTHPTGKPTHIEIEWSPIMNQADEIEKILVAVRDITAIIELEKASAEQTRQLTIVNHLIQHPAEKFAELYGTWKKYDEENRSILGQGTPSLPMENIKLLFINLHTLKGEARSLGFTFLTEQIHLAEQRYADVLRQQIEPTEIEEFLLDLDTISSAIEEYNLINSSKLGRSSTHEHQFSVPLNIANDWLNEIQNQKANPNPKTLVPASLESSLVEALYEPVDVALTRIFTPIKTIAKDLGKKRPHINIQAQGFRFKRKTITQLNQVFVHILRNIMDHGIEEDLERLNHGKPARGTIRVTTTRQSRGFSMKIKDDGKGLNLNKLREKGSANGLYPANETDWSMIANSIFHDGLSSRDQVSDISGRGVGMSAIRKFVRDMGGDVIVQLENESLTYPGYWHFTLELALPDQVVFDDEAEVKRTTQSA